MTALITPPIVWLEDEATTKAVTGKTPYQLRKWARDEGLAIHKKAFASGATRSYILTDEFLAFVRATSVVEQEEA